MAWESESARWLKAGAPRITSAQPPRIAARTYYADLQLRFRSIQGQAAKEGGHDDILGVDLGQSR